MNQAAPLGAQRIAVAVAFDEHSETLVREAASLCQLLGKSLCLIHVVEPSFTWPQAALMQENPTLWSMSQSIDGSSQMLATEKLKALAGQVASGVATDCVVTLGKARERLIVEAKERDCGLLLVGAQLGKSSSFSRGLSTAAALMAASPIPVLVFDSGRHPPLALAPRSFLIADDLEPHTEAAVGYATQLAACLGQTSLLHVHVSNLSRSVLTAALESAAAAGRTLPGPKIAIDAVFESVNAQLSKRLTERAAPYLQSTQVTKAAYEARIVEGGIRSDLGAIIQAASPRLLVFGRHQAIHMQPFFLGRMPFRTMLSYDLPVLVVPGEA